jgi:hypothetical protein
LNTDFTTLESDLTGGLSGLGLSTLDSNLNTDFTTLESGLTSDFSALDSLLSTDLSSLTKVRAGQASWAARSSTGNLRGAIAKAR